MNAGDSKLSIHSGIGAGTLVGYTVGGFEDRWEYVVTGDPIAQIGTAEPEANAGEVVMSEMAYKQVIDFVKGEKLSSRNFKLLSIEALPFPKHDSIASCLYDMSFDTMKQIQKLLRGFVPKPVLKAIEGGPQNQWVAELRVVNTLFIRILKVSYENESSLPALQRK